MESYRGTLIPAGITKEEAVKNYLQNYTGYNTTAFWHKKQLETDDKLSDIKILLHFANIKDLIEINDVVYKIDSIEHTKDTQLELKENPDKSISFSLHYDPNNSCFETAIKKASKELK
jgi:hypothetical protein